jgi:hypothetical protein
MIAYGEKRVHVHALGLELERRIRSLRLHVLHQSIALPVAIGLTDLLACFAVQVQAPPPSSHAESQHWDGTPSGHIILQ